MHYQDEHEVLERNHEEAIGECSGCGYEFPTTELKYPQHTKRLRIGFCADCLEDFKAGLNEDFKPITKPNK